jgi:predicted amidophosphoribosyltransferase
MRMPLFKLKSRKGWTLCENCTTPILRGKNKKFCEKCLKEKQKVKNHKNYLKQRAMGWRHY